jgi:hypothetical protein
MAYELEEQERNPVMNIPTDGTPQNMPLTQTADDSVPTLEVTPHTGVASLKTSNEPSKGIGTGVASQPLFINRRIREVSTKNEGRDNYSLSHRPLTGDEAVTEKVGILPDPPEPIFTVSIYPGVGELNVLRPRERRSRT